MVNYWSQVCSTQANLPLSQLLQANYGGCIFAVSALLRICFARAYAVHRPLMLRVGCFVRVCFDIKRVFLRAVGQVASFDEAARTIVRALIEFS